jgi:hypothetical protein
MTALELRILVTWEKVLVKLRLNELRESHEKNH